MTNEKIQTITLSDIKYVEFRRRNFHLIENEYELKDSFEEINRDYTPYKPFDIPDLYEQFSKINPNSKVEMLDFINKYGNIGTYDDPKRPVAEKYFERCSYWKDKILEMKHSILLLDLYNSENIKYAVELNKSKIREYGDGFLYKHICVIKNDNLCIFSLSNKECSDCGQCKDFLHKYVKPREDEVKLQEDYDLRSLCLSDLQSSIKDNIGEISFIPMIDVDSNGKPCIRPNVRFPSLLSIMYWQLHMRFFENKRYFTCEGCNKTVEWSNNKKNYLCNGCSDHHKYKEQMSIASTKAHRNFMNKSGHYTSKSPSSCLYIYDGDKEILGTLREKIKDESLENQKIMNDEDYLIWLNKQNEIFMNKVKEYKKEE